MSEEVTNQSAIIHKMSLDDFEIIKNLGKGSFGKVKHVMKKDNKVE